MSEGKILIMGVGGCGSSFIWGLLGDCGLDTGGINEYMRHSGIRNAISNGTAGDWKFPKVIKHLGGFINNLSEHIERHNWEVEHVFFTVASYELQMKSYKKRKHFKNEEEIKTQEDQYRIALGKGLLHIIEKDISFEIFSFSL